MDSKFTMSIGVMGWMAGITTLGDIDVLIGWDESDALQPGLLRGGKLVEGDRHTLGVQFDRSRLVRCAGECSPIHVGHMNAT